MSSGLRLAATTRPWASLPIGRSLDGVVRAGFDSVALPVHGVADALTGDVPPAQAQRIGGLVAERGLDLLMLSHEAAFDRADDEALAALRRQIDHCALLGVALLIDVGCQIPADFERYFRLMRAGAPYAGDHGVTIAMKSHGGLSRTIDDTLAALHRVDHPAFRICLDTGMLVHHAGDAALTGLEQLAPHVVAVGARDHPGRGGGPAARRDPGHDAPGVPPATTPGEGVVDFARVYDLLARHGFTGPSALESVRPALTPEETDRLAATAREYLREAMSVRGDGPPPPGADYTKEPSATARAEQLDCTTLSRVRGEKPLGTARHFDSYLLVELALPWPRAMGRPLAEYPRAADDIRGPLRHATAAAERGGRLVKPLALDPDPAYSRPGFTRVLRFDLHPAPSSGYDRWEFVVPDKHAPGVIAALYDPEPAALDPYRQWRRDDAGRRDLLVCTHGSVDACCGTYGYPLYEQLRARLGDDDTTHAWRVSSFGGHRFAPSVIDLPDGRFWGNVTTEHIEALVTRTGPVDEVMDAYRGSGVWSHPIAQVAEAGLFAHHGWSWVGHELELRSLDSGLDEKQACLFAAVTSPRTGHRSGFEITVSLVDDIDVIIGCTGLHGRIPVYELTSLVEVPVSEVPVTDVEVTGTPRRSDRGRPLDLDRTAHASRGGEAAH